MKLFEIKNLPFLFCIPLFFCFHSYNGLITDSRLYLLAVVNKWFPERFLNDPAFMFGNQDSYSLFTLIYSAFVKVFGVNVGSEICCILFHLVWIFAVFYLLKSLCRKCDAPSLFIPVSIIYICLTAYDMPFTRVIFFNFVETFACSRTLSVALGILGFAFLIDGKKYRSLISIVAGLAIHPITAGWVLPVWLFYYYPKTRLPIMIGSLFFPLTFLLHKGPFDIYPEYWAEATCHHHVEAGMLVREFLGIAFLAVAIKKNTVNSFLLKFSNALLAVLIIGTYWTATGGVGKHIFIYQAQTWRIEWMLWTFEIPLYIIVLRGKIANFIKSKQLFLYDFCYVLWGFVLLLPNYEIGLSIFLLILNLQKNKIVDFSFIKKIIGMLSIYTFVMQIWIDVDFSTGLGVICKILDYKLLWQNISFLALVEFVLILAMLIYDVAIHKFNVKNVLAIFFLLVFCVKSQYLGIPVLIMAMYVDLPVKKSLTISCAILFFVFDGLTMDGVRSANCFESVIPYLKKWWVHYIVCMVPLAIVFLSRRKLLNRRIVSCIIAALSLTLGVVACKNYDSRTENRIAAEKGIDAFLYNPIFPQVGNREKTLFYVHGSMLNSSRTQFLTGAYFDNSTHVGEMLFEKQFIESRRRENLIYYKADLGITAKRMDFDEFLERKLCNQDTLVDRTHFLCEIGEISHLVTDFPNLPLSKIDSTTLYNKQTVYLYGCSGQPLK